jgi:phosphatidylinositol glycan class B
MHPSTTWLLLTSSQLLLSLSSFFHGLALARTFSNSMETSLTTLALSYWLPITHPVHSKKLEKARDSKPPSALAARKLILPLSIAALACAIRPTNAVLWTYLVGTYLFDLRKQPIQIAQTLFVAGLIGYDNTRFIRPTENSSSHRAISILAIIGIDTWYYRDLTSTLTFTALNFLRTNLSSISLFYGGMPWHYYLTQACPILLTTCLPFFLHGVSLNFRSPTTRGDSSSAELSTLMGLTIWTTAVYSLAGHKEWRFLHPLLPIMHLFCTKSLLHLNTRRTTNLICIPPRSLVLVLLQIPAMIYVAFFHGRAQIAVMDYLRSIPPADLTSVGFLMPCHSTPWQAYLHRANLVETGRMWALSCEPPLG